MKYRLALVIGLAAALASLALGHAFAQHVPSADEIKGTVDAGKHALDASKVAIDAWQDFAVKAGWIFAGLQFLITQGSAWFTTVRDAPGAKLIAGNYGKAENKA